MYTFYTYTDYAKWRDEGDKSGQRVMLVGECCADWKDKYDMTQTTARLTKNLEHWRHEVAKRRSQVDRLKAELTAANQRAEASVASVAQANAERDALKITVQGLRAQVTRLMYEVAASECEVRRQVWLRPYIRTLTPPDATAALDRVKDEAWNAAIDAAADKYIHGSGGCSWDFFKDAHDAILALRKPQEQSHD